MDYFIPLNPTSSPPLDFSHSTLVLPQPSLASIPQLASDLLVHSLGLPLVGHLGLRDFVPAISGLDETAGNEASGSEKAGGLSVTLAVQVFHSAEHNFTIVLPRSPVIKARKQHHVAALSAFINAAGFKDVLVISSVDAAMRGDEALALPTPLRSLLARTPTTPSTLLSERLSQLPPYSSTQPSQSTTVPLLPASGLTRSILLALPSAPALLIYAAEGLALEPVYETAGVLLGLLGIEGAGVEWKEPKSWDKGLMGDELGIESRGDLYG